MNLPQIVKFLFLILVFEAVIAGYPDDDSRGKKDCARKGNGCPSKPEKTDDDYDDGFDAESDDFDEDSAGFWPDSDDSEDDSTSDKCDGNRDKCPSKSRINKLQGSCNRCGIASGGTGGGRVINGRPVVPVYKYPWIVSLIIGNQIMCGGALISENFVMTAGHCVFNKPMIRLPQCRGRRVHRSCYLSPNAIRIGLFSAQQRTPSETMAVRRIVNYPMYSFSMQIHDFALIELAGPVRCSTYTMPVCLPPRDFSKLGTPLITAGYGDNTPEGRAGPQLLREGSVREIDPRKCATRAQPVSFIKTIVCAAGMESGQSSCFGDSGSSLFNKFGNKFYAVGVVSKGTQMRCSAQNPVVYTKVYSVLPFIRQHVRNLPRG